MAIPHENGIYSRSTNLDVESNSRDPSTQLAMMRMPDDLADSYVAPESGEEILASLPPVFVAEITVCDSEGNLLAIPEKWRCDGPPPLLRVVLSRKRHRAPGTGDRALVRRRSGMRAEIIRVISRRPQRIVGVYRNAHGGSHGSVRTVERRGRASLPVAAGDEQGAKSGDLVIAKTTADASRARVTSVLCTFDGPEAVARMVLARHEIPQEFSAETLSEARSARPVGLGDRTDLREFPLITIDEEDARDFDDAVWSEPVDGGWHMIVAVADVAHYVRPGTALDRDARRRGTSVYLPDRVVPMLPEALSDGLCSLQPGEDRACIAAHLWIDADGALIGHRFERALMRSAARLTYREVEECGARDRMFADLFGAFGALGRARKARGSLAFDLPERQIVFDARGKECAAAPRPRYASHRLIEEFMVTANTAAAETLVARCTPFLFRVHDRPRSDKLERLQGCLANFGYKIAQQRKITVGKVNEILDRFQRRPEYKAIATALLRTQSLAEYSPHNIGHFGLNLAHYTHFTSPIRRYADLLVHRALIGALGLGSDRIGPMSVELLAEAGAAVTVAERRAAMAERDAVDRLTVRLLAAKVGRKFRARAIGVTRFGLFVALAGSGAEGLVPMRSFAGRVRYDRARDQIVHTRSGAGIGLGTSLSVVLKEADTVTGTLRFAPDPQISPWHRAPFAA